MDVDKIIVKAHLLGLDDGEIKLLEYLKGISGSFYTGLYDLFVKADFENKEKLMSAFPELQIYKKYLEEPEWFESYFKQKMERIGT
jgi:hypothetical protein